MAEPGVTAILLAAGASRRFGDENKLLAELAGKSLVRIVAETLEESRVKDIIVVTGHDGANVKASLSGLDVRLAENPDHEEGLTSSLRCGLKVVSDEAAGAMIVLGDMPGVTVGLIDRLIAAFEEGKGEKITFPQRADGAQGNPVIWPRAFFPELMKLEGDKGAKELIAKHADRTLAVPSENDDAFRDIDAPDDLAAWTRE